MNNRVNNSNREDDIKIEDVDNRGEDIGCESNFTREFDAILKDIKNISRLLNQ